MRSSIHDALKARIEADLARAQDRVEWSKRMMDKGYASKQQYESEVLKHYEALKARLWEERLSPEVLKEYEALKARMKQQSAIESEMERKAHPASPDVPKATKERGRNNFPD